MRKDDSPAHVQDDALGKHVYRVRVDYTKETHGVEFHGWSEDVVERWLGGGSLTYTREVYADERVHDDK